MKKLLLAILTLGSLNTFAGDVIDQYSKIQIRQLPTEETNSTMHIGVLLNFKAPKKLGIYGALENDKKYDSKPYRYDLLGEIEMSSVSAGLTINIAGEEDNIFTLNNVEGSQLDEVCNDYYGLKASLAIWIGGTGFSTINSDGIILRSNATVGGLKGDVSGLKVKIKCLNKNNPNWKKVVRF